MVHIPNIVSMTCSISSVIADSMKCSFIFVEDVFLRNCGREIEQEALRSSPVGGDHIHVLARVSPPPRPRVERRASSAPGLSRTRYSS